MDGGGGGPWRRLSDLLGLSAELLGSLLGALAGERGDAGRCGPGRPGEFAVADVAVFVHARTPFGYRP